MTIAALYVAKDGTYFGIPGVDPWDEARDARGYQGPHPVVAHPPCERWGRYWSGGPSARVRRVLGDDDGCFAAALASVRQWGGVLEHPEATHAFKRFGLPLPERKGGWTAPDAYGGRSCCVEQGHYGHPARKATWLYAVRTGYPALVWGLSYGKRRLDRGYHSAAERSAAKAAGEPPIKRLSKRERVETPAPFRDLLIEIARSARRGVTQPAATDKSEPEPPDTA